MWGKSHFAIRTEFQNTVFDVYRTVIIWNFGVGQTGYVPYNFPFSVAVCVWVVFC
uniref:Uncharacterized protein n=1 Tax=Myoviridae sp. ctoIO8 TaxID=2825173 RepID=A0A8S5P352_9CAUD|nr:MAG TPA: hypothetical protein [Myoviridae sp. ctoIO8]